MLETVPNHLFSSFDIGRRIMCISADGHQECGIPLHTPLPFITFTEDWLQPEERLTLTGRRPISFMMPDSPRKSRSERAAALRGSSQRPFSNGHLAGHWAASNLRNPNCLWPLLRGPHQTIPHKSMTQHQSMASKSHAGETSNIRGSYRHGPPQGQGT